MPDGSICAATCLLPSPPAQVGLQASASHFFVFMAFMVLCSSAATSLAVMVSALCR
jgi:hypothetical protein